MLHRNFLLTVGALAVLAMSGCTTVPAAADTQTTLDNNTRVVTGFLNMMFNEHKVAEAFEKYVGPTYTQHNPNVADGKEAAIKGLTFVTTQKYPEMKLEIKRTIAQGNLVVVHTHEIRDAKEAQSGGGVAIAEIFRLENGKIVEHWDVVQEIPATPKNNNTMF